MFVSRQYLIIICVLIAVAAILGVGLLTRGHDWGGDFAQYISQAQSIVDGSVDSFMVSNRMTIEASEANPPIGPVAYPWGLPLLLAPVYALWGVQLTAFKLVGVVSYLLFLWCYGRYTRLRHSEPISILLVAVFAVNPVLLSFLNQIASDIPFLLVSTLVILLISDNKKQSGSRQRAILIGALIGAAFLLRTNGILLVIPLAAHQFFGWLSKVRQKPEPGPGIRLLFSLSNILPWVILGSVFLVSAVLLPEGGSSHVGHLAHVTWPTIQTNLVYYVKLPLAFYEGVPGRQIICLITYPLALIGMIIRVRKDHPLILYIGATLGIYVIWPDSMQGLRFLFPLLPFYVSFTVSGLLFLANRLPSAGKHYVRLAGLLLCLYVIGSMAVVCVVNVRANQKTGRQPPDGPYTEEAAAMFDVIKRITGPDDHIVCVKPRVMRFLTGRPSTLQRSMARISGGEYILWSRERDGAYWPIYPAQMIRAVEAGDVEKVYESDRFEIYRMKSLSDN